MTAKELKKAQEDIDDQVKELAETKGLTSGNNGCQPIRDGIADEEAYLESGLKVAWILKEPYDDFNENGMPCGGGWSLTKNCFLEHDENWIDKNGHKQWKNRVWQVITYVMYGFRHGLYWEKMNRIRNEPSMMDEIKSVAWINLSKMPAKKTSSNGSFGYYYATAWESIVTKQISVYCPDVLIFGRTFNAFKQCYKGIVPEHEADLENWMGTIWHVGSQFWIDTLHPGRKGRIYVNALIDALTRIQETIRQRL